MLAVMILEDGLRHPSVMWMPASWPAVTLTFDLQNLGLGLVVTPCQFYRNCSSRSRDIVVTIST